MGKKEFGAAAHKPEHKAIVVYVAALRVDSDNKMNPSKRVQIAYLKANNAPNKVSNEYATFADVFLSKLAAKLPKYTRIKDYAIELVDDCQLPYGSIYSLGPVKLEILKMYIENNLLNSFIEPSKFPAKAPIHFNKKPNGSLQL